MPQGFVLSVSVWSAVIARGRLGPLWLRKGSWNHDPEAENGAAEVYCTGQNRSCSAGAAAFSSETTDVSSFTFHTEPITLNKGQFKNTLHGTENTTPLP